MRRNRLVLLVAAACATVAIPLAVYWWQTKPAANHLGLALRDFGFRPLALPTSHMSVGSLYYVDPHVRIFDVVCPANRADMEDAIERATGADLRMDILTNGQFESNVKVDLGWAFKGNLAANTKQTVHFSLTDIVVESITHEKSVELFLKMAGRPHCSTAVADVINNGGYVCQNLKVFEATAEYKLDRDTMNKIGGGAATEKDVKDIVKLAVETQSGQDVVNREGRVQSGRKLKYAVAMKPTCMSPIKAYFPRVLPDGTFGRLTNYVLFNVLEPYWPFWPSKEEHTRTAEIGNLLVTP